MKEKLLKFSNKNKPAIVIAATEAFLVAVVIFLCVMVLNAPDEQINSDLNLKEFNIKFTMSYDSLDLEFTLSYDSLTLNQAAIKEAKIRSLFGDAKIQVEVDDVEKSEKTGIWKYSASLHTISDQDETESPK